ncbi:MAG: NYN domain-containing protein [Eubacteriales bacterium]|nr:NYN domain-containing protein [Eubacteriales bacterium]MDD3350358.1 NYN domain-containing protein [Eubacteriales bacterium]
MASEHRFAVLIDADNISDKYIKFILDEISYEGVATYKRIYGDWTKPALAPWKRVLLEYSIAPIQQYGYTTGKNATDAAMIIDAMDILYSGNVDGFCLVTSDSDFTRLAARLRESGMDVVGMGERKTPKPFIVACNKFKYLDILAAQDAENKQTTAKQTETKIKKEDIKERIIKSKAEEVKKKDKLVIALPEGFDETEEGKDESEIKPEMTTLETIEQAVLMIIRENSGEDDWVFIGDIGNMLLKRYPDFDVRNFGYQKLTPFIRSMPQFEIRTEKHGSSMLVYVKEKETKNKA